MILNFVYDAYTFFYAMKNPNKSRVCHLLYKSPVND